MTKLFIVIGVWTFVSWLMKGLDILEGRHV